jgi:hypothetical protein
MSSFAEDIYPLRFRRARFIKRLLAKVDTDWTRITSVRHLRNLPGSLRRYNTNPAFRDKRRIKALLNAWGRGYHDRYLDLQRFRSLDNRRYRSESEAFNLLKQNAPTGAVMFVMNEIERSWEPYFFGRNLWEGWGYNAYFSYLLRWDDQHCHGLVDALLFEEGTHHHGTPPFSWAAVRRWLVANQTRLLYREADVTLR